LAIAISQVRTHHYRVIAIEEETRLHAYDRKVDSEFTRLRIRQAEFTKALALKSRIRRAG